MEQMLERPSFRFTAPFNVEIVEIKGQERVFLEGIISSTHIDLVDDLVTKNCLESFKKQIMEKSLKLDLEHEAFRGDSVEEKELNKTKIPVGKMFDADVKAVEKNHFGLFVKSELNPFEDRFDQIKGNVKEGFLDAYSIAFIPTKTAEQMIGGKSVRLLDDAILLNVALTGNPINTQAKNREIFMKSIESLEDYKKEKKANPGVEGSLIVKSHDHKSDSQLNSEVKMSEEENKKPEEGEESAEPTEPTEPEKKDEETKEPEAPKEPEKPGKEEGSEEVKALKAELALVKSELSEIKALLKKPVRKSIVDQQDKSDNFEAKSQNPLDLIA
jgi:hypothetical protein